MSENKSQDIYFTNCLLKAMSSNELRLFIQPQINMRSGKIVSGEVLIRMPSKSSANFAQDFINTPIDVIIKAAINQKAIKQLSEWILATTIKKLNNNEGLIDKTIPLAVNMPPNMINDEFIDFIKECLAANQNVAQSQLCIEITEFPEADNLNLLNSNIQKLRAIGIKIVLDDFGSGYATMRYLTALEVDAVKIDQSFVQQAPESKSAYMILTALIGLIKAIDLKVICEGVENPEQMAILKNTDCDMGQGFLIGRATEFDKFWQIVAERKNINNY